MKKFIPLSAPALAGNEKKYVLDCLQSNWISSNGKYIERFEKKFAGYCGVKHAISCCNGTAALHLALLALGTGPGDEIIVPTLTYVATANAVSYCGARPVFVDSEAGTWNIDPGLIEEKISPRTRGIIAVHLYGCPADLGAVRSLARRRGLFVIEDAAEAHGAEYRGRRVGSLSEIATFSFYGNKVISSGEGGMVVTGDRRLADRVRLLKGQGMQPERRYWFPLIGYNYRMTNIQAALGLAQLEKIDWHLRRRQAIAEIYLKHLRGVPGLVLAVPPRRAKSVCWLFSVVLDENVPLARDEVMKALGEKGIETRPFFYPMHILPPYQALAAGQDFPVADRLGRRGINLPTWAGLKEEDVAYICTSLKRIISK